MVVFKSSTNRPEAYRFLRYLTSPLVQKYWSDSLGQIPVNLRAFDLVNVSEKPILSTFMEQMKTAIARPKVLKYGHLEEIINPLMESALSGDLTAKQALDAAVKRINQEVLATPETKK
jgi:multiple sugar transport system substrate-binding protein